MTACPLLLIIINTHYSIHQMTFDPAFHPADGDTVSPPWNRHARLSMTGNLQTGASPCIACSLPPNTEWMPTILRDIIKHLPK